MFNKIAIADNKILIMRYIVSWQETMQHGEIDEETGEITTHTETIDRADITDNPERITAYLKKQDIAYTVTNIEVPAEIEQYDGTVWTEGRDKALLMINGDASYQIERLKKQLSAMDYKTSKFIDGDYDGRESEWADIVAERKAIRDKINELEDNKP